MTWHVTGVAALRRLLMRHTIGVVLVLVLAYFGYHSIHGERGLLRWIDYSRLVEEKRLELAEMQARRAELEQRVEALRPGRTSGDLAEEELKRLGYARHDEVIILRPPKEP